MRSISWLGKHPDDISLAKCKVCAKDSVGGLGVKALSLHAQGSKHQDVFPTGSNKPYHLRSPRKRLLLN